MMKGERRKKRRMGENMIMKYIKLSKCGKENQKKGKGKGKENVEGGREKEEGKGGSISPLFFILSLFLVLTLLCYRNVNLLQFFCCYPPSPSVSFFHGIRF